MKKRIRYALYNPNYERVRVGPGYIEFRNCETARTLRQAIRKARRMGPGTEIERHLPNGKIQSWVFDA